MRIIAGSRRGASLFPPTTDDIRPMPDMVRQGLFNILGQDLTGQSVLDLFAGTGAVGLEAVSRGAQAAVLVDKGREALELCRRNTLRLRFEDRVEILALPASLALARLAGRERRFDLIFAGPPYAIALPELNALLEAIADLPLLGDEGIFVLQLPVGLEPLLPPRLDLVKERAYGKNRLLFFVRHPASHAEANPV